MAWFKSAAVPLLLVLGTAAAWSAAEPVFSSGGIRAKVASIAAAPDKKSLTVAVVIDNTSDGDLALAMIGQPPQAIDNKANAFIAGERTISGIATCQLNPKAPEKATANCLNNTSSGLPPERYTFLEKGASLTVILHFYRGAGGAPLGDLISFSSLVAVRQVSSPTAPAGKVAYGAPRAVSVGIPLIPLAE
jgi:hypothetical protein